MVRFPIFLAVIAIAVPAMAFDALWHDLAIVPADPTSPAPAFYYAAPDRTVDLRDGIWVSGQQGIMQAMVDPGPPFRLTGVDFSTVYAVFDTGLPPNQAAIIHGTPGFVSTAPAVLEERAFTSVQQDGFTVVTKGEDHAFNMQDRVLGEPFSGNLGKAYRLALADDFAVLSFSTAQMAELTAALANPDDCTTCMPWRDLLDAIRAAAGPGAVLDAASGYSVASLIAIPSLPEEGDQIVIPKSLMPPYLLAMFAVTRDAGHHPTLYMSLLFPNAEIARTGAKVAAVGMQALLDEVAEEGSPLAGGKARPVVNSAIATLVVTFDHPVGAALGYNRWIHMVMNRDFALLSPG
jgi:hypothetical protein